MNVDLVPFTFEGRQVRTDIPRRRTAALPLSFRALISINPKRKSCPPGSRSSPSQLSCTNIYHIGSQAQNRCPSKDDVFAATTHLEICLLRNSPELTIASLVCLSLSVRGAVSYKGETAQSS